MKLHINRAIYCLSSIWVLTLTASWFTSKQPCVLLFLSTLYQYCDALCHLRRGCYNNKLLLSPFCWTNQWASERKYPVRVLCLGSREREDCKVKKEEDVRSLGSWPSCPCIGGWAFIQKVPDTDSKVGPPCHRYSQCGLRQTSLQIIPGGLLLLTV